MDKRVAFDPIDYFAVECVGRRLSKNRMIHSHQIARIQQDAAVAFGKSARQRLTGYQPLITPTPIYEHKMRPPKNR